ncbi:MAG: class I SAM-dependent methyltransferase [Dehalococcoidia bacterium]
MPESEIRVFDSLAADYDIWFEEEGRLIFASEVEALRQVVPLLPRPWLEAGVGSGRFAQALGVDIGLDPSRKLLEMAGKRRINVILGRGEEMPFQNGVFGTVFLVVTLCFVDSPERILSETARTLRSEGKIVLGMVLSESPWGRFYQMKKSLGHRLYEYARFYNYGEVERFLKQAGFHIEEVLSTLFQNPGEVGHVEEPDRKLSREAGFTVVLAGKGSS